MIRDIKMHELKTILEYGCSFPENQSVLGGLDTPHFIRKFSDMMKHGAAHCFGIFSDDGRVHGALGFMASEGMFSPEKTAFQIFWWTGPEYRGKGVLLLKEYERQARALGCVRMHMPHQVKRQDANFGRFLVRFGFEENEMRYFKELNP